MSKSYKPYRQAETLDDQYLKVAINGSADFILTGDTDLLELHSFHEIPIYSPSQFFRKKRVKFSDLKPIRGYSHSP